MLDKIQANLEGVLGKLFLNFQVIPQQKSMCTFASSLASLAQTDPNWTNHPECLLIKHCFYFAMCLLFAK